MRVQFRLFLLFNCIALTTFGQEKALRNNSLLLYGDLYYSYPINSTTKWDEPLMVNHSNNKQVAINTIIANYAFATEKMRVNAGVVIGSYEQVNYQLEPLSYRKLYQANIGLRISQKHNIWIDAGVMPSHIGLESVIAADNPTIYRSLAAEFSPYYEAGLKVSAQKGNHMAAFYVLNGWQRIRRATPNAWPALGGQYTYTHSKFSFNWSSFLGNLEDKTYYDFLFNNFYATVGNEKWKLYLGVDLGMGKLPDTTNSKVLYTTYGILQHSINSKNKVAVRMEYYSDPSRVLVQPFGSNISLDCLGASVTYSYEVLEGCLLRTEYRYLVNDTEIFVVNDGSNLPDMLATSKHMFCLSLSYKLNKVFP